MNSNKGKNIVITGASRGFGKAVAEAFAAAGARLFLSSRNEVALYNTVALLQTKYPDALIKAKAFDLSVKEQAIQLGNWVNENCQAVDVLVNNAGNFLPGSVHSEPDGVLEAMINTNLYSAYHLTRTVVPNMITAKSGYIFNICSIASLQAYTNGGAYSISKFALLGFSKNLREEMKAHNVKVCSIMPGAVLTDSWGEYDNSNNRIMEAKDVADIILAATNLSAAAVIEDIVLRPQLGDL